MYVLKSDNRVVIWFSRSQKQDAKQGSRQLFTIDQAGVIHEGKIRKKPLKLQVDESGQKLLDSGAAGSHSVGYSIDLFEKYQIDRSDEMTEINFIQWGILGLIT